MEDSMRKLLIPFVTLAIMALPAAANAEQCRDTATGKYAKCGAPGAVLASKYVAKGKTTHATAPAMAAPATTAKPGMMSMMKPKAKATPAPAATPAAATTKAARCKTAKGKFIKCGMPGAIPA
jgi:hypothetical protein